MARIRALEEEKARAEEEAKKKVAVLEPVIETCPKGMRYIASGPFQIGSAADDPMRNFGERALAEVQVASFCIDVYEFPNRARAPPRTNVTWQEARRACEKAGKRLCTEEEWEKACKGPAGHRWPYGDVFAPDACNTEDAEGNDRPLAPGGQSSQCKSGYGVYDMSGNAYEWTATPFQAGAEDRTLKGGAANRPDWDTRCASRTNKPPGFRNAYVGFRCCADPKRTE